MGYVLVSPSGKAVEETFDPVSDAGCWARSFDFLYRRSKWMRPYWKQWDESRAAAGKRGWGIAKARVEIVS